MIYSKHNFQPFIMLLFSNLPKNTGFSDSACSSEKKGHRRRVRAKAWEKVLARGGPRAREPHIPSALHPPPLQPPLRGGLQTRVPPPLSSL